jgi:SnoaL-like domain
VTTATTTEHEEFVQFFGAGWAIGATDPDAFFAHFEPAFARNARFVQPLVPNAVGAEGLREIFLPVFAAVPDLRSEVRSFRPTEDGLVIEHTLRGTLGSTPLQWDATDTFVLRDGLIEERRADFDPKPLLLAILRNPRAAAPLLGATPLHRALSGLALGRIGLGTLARLAPGPTTRLFGAGYAAGPELDYMNRVFGARAFALGTGYLLSSGEARRLWQRLALVCDVSDTVAGVGHLVRGDIPRRSAVAATALTGGYMLVGLAKVLAERQER